MRDVALRARDAGHPPVLVKLDLRLGEVEVDRASGLAPPVEDSGQLLHHLEVFHLRAVFKTGRSVAREHGVYGSVGHAPSAADDAGQKLVLDDAALGINFHQRGHRQAVDARVQAADAVRQLERQHGHGTVGKIHRRAAQPRFAVERHARPHVVGDVGDMDLEQIVAVK